MGTVVTIVTAISACTVFSGDGYGGSAVGYDYKQSNSNSTRVVSRQILILCGLWTETHAVLCWNGAHQQDEIAF